MNKSYGVFLVQQKVAQTHLMIVILRLCHVVGFYLSLIFLLLVLTLIFMSHDSWNSFKNTNLAHLAWYNVTNID